mgnify:CR=1 FL=1
MKVCRYCGKEFKRDHLHARHERVQCKSKPEAREPDHAKHIELARRLVEQNREESLNDRVSDIKRKNREEAEVLHKNVIKLKNRDSLYAYKCVYCDEGFEYEREKVDHEKGCVYREGDDDRGEMERLRDEVSLCRRELERMQGLLSEMRKKVELVELVKGQLMDLKEIEFQLKLFKNATLKVR